MTNFSTFINCDQLVKNYQSLEYLIIDCRFDLSDPNWGYQDYLKYHIPNAIYADLDKDLSGPKTELTGRHPLPATLDFLEICSLWGVDPQKQVVVYDTTAGSFAARLWWMLKYYGHSNVAILEGGISAWKSHEFPLESGNVVPKPSHFSATLNQTMLVTTTELEEIIETDDKLLLDARSPERFSGKEEPIDKIAGRIPKSLNFFHQSNLDNNGNLLPKNELLTKYNELLGNTSSQDVILYCGSGVTSCFNIAVLQHIGIGTPRLYLGSWSEWITNPSHTIINDSLK